VSCSLTIAYEGICHRFFELFDNDRNQLLVAYAPNATLSMNFTSAVPPRAKAAGYLSTLPNQRALNFERLKKLPHRNLIHTGPSRWTKSLIVATDENKLRAWLNDDLPKTRHPLSEVGKWMYDVIGMDPVNGVGRIMLIVHGEFAECES
jgi:nuclear RNA export factor